MLNGRNRSTLTGCMTRIGRNVATTSTAPRSKSAWAHFFAHGVVPKLEALDYIARAITPPNRPRRFDARFFTADSSAIADELDAPHTDELLTPCWLTFAEARALDVPVITRAVLVGAQSGHQIGL